MLSYDVAILYSFFMQQAKVKERMTKPWVLLRLTGLIPEWDQVWGNTATHFLSISPSFFLSLVQLLPYLLPPCSSLCHYLPFISLSSFIILLSIPFPFFLHSFFSPPHPTLLSLRMSEVAQTASKKPIRPGVRNLVLDMCCSDENGEDVDVPYIKYSFWQTLEY